MFLKDEQATLELGRRLGRRAPPGTVFALQGDLGAGKSCLARGMARGLGIEGRIPSPTFVLVAEYRSGRLPFHHLDLYRLDDEADLLQLGLDEVLAEQGICAVEWPERAPGWLEHAIWIQLSDAGDGRRVEFRGPTAVIEQLLG